MSLLTDLQAAVAQAQADQAKLTAIVQGPPTGADSLVTVTGGTVKTLSRITAEHNASTAWTTVNANGDLAIGGRYNIDTSGGALTSLTLSIDTPPADGDTIEVNDLGSNFATHSATIVGKSGANGKQIELEGTLDDSLVLDSPMRMIFIFGANCWRCR